MEANNDFICNFGSITLFNSIEITLWNHVLCYSEKEFQEFAQYLFSLPFLLWIYFIYFLFSGYLQFYEELLHLRNFYTLFLCLVFNGLNSQRNKGDLNIQFRNRKFFQYRENCTGYRMNGNQDIRRIRRRLHSTGKKKGVKERWYNVKYPVKTYLYFHPIHFHIPYFIRRYP